MIEITKKKPNRKTKATNKSKKTKELATVDGADKVDRICFVRGGNN